MLLFLLLLNSDCRQTSMSNIVTSLLMSFYFLFLPLTWVLVTVVTDSFTDDRATVVLTWWLTSVPTMHHSSPEEKDEEGRSIDGSGANNMMTTWWCHCIQNLLQQSTRSFWFCVTTFCIFTTVQSASSFQSSCFLLLADSVYEMSILSQIQLKSPKVHLTSNV